MLRVLFDKNVPYLLRRHLMDYQVQTADDEGWGQVSNDRTVARIATRVNRKIIQRISLAGRLPLSGEPVRARQQNSAARCRIAQAD